MWTSNLWEWRRTLLRENRRDTEKKEATENLHDDQVVDHALIPYDSNP